MLVQDMLGLFKKWLKIQYQVENPAMKKELVNK